VSRKENLMRFLSGLTYGCRVRLTSKLNVAVELPVEGKLTNCVLDHTLGEHAAPVYWMTVSRKGATCRGGRKTPLGFSGGLRSLIALPRYGYA
jgi:hypothetical protein